MLSKLLSILLEFLVSLRALVCVRSYLAISVSLPGLVLARWLLNDHQGREEVQGMKQLWAHGSFLRRILQPRTMHGDPPGPLEPLHRCSPWHLSLHVSPLVMGTGTVSGRNSLAGSLVPSPLTGEAAFLGHRGRQCSHSRRDMTG